MSVRGRVGPAWRISAVAGAVLGLISVLYLLVTWIDESTVAILVNPHVRTADLGYGALAAGILAVAVVVAVSRSRWFTGWALAAAGLGFATTAANALAASERRDRLASLLVFVLPSVALLLVSAVLWCRQAPRRARCTVGLVAGLVVVVPGLAVTWLEGPLEEARVFAGLHPAWKVERQVDHVVVDDAGTVWGVRPWEAATLTSLSRRDPGTGRFESVLERADGWPPLVLGTDDEGATWMVSSERDDPFEPVFELVLDGRSTRIDGPERPLPPLDAVALDPRGPRLYGLHSNFALPGRAVLEVYDGGRWHAVDTPVTYEDRAALVDMAVDRHGRVWVWHDEQPSTLRRYDGRAWSTVELAFDLESNADLSLLAPSLDPLQPFLRSPSGRLWVFDRDGRRLALLGPSGALVRSRPLPEGAVPLAVDDRARAWCRGPVGLLVVDADGRVLYDAEASGIPRSRVASVAVTEERAWVQLLRGGARELLRFDHATALPRVGAS